MLHAARHAPAAAQGTGYCQPPSHANSPPHHSWELMVAWDGVVWGAQDCTGSSGGSTWLDVAGGAWGQMWAVEGNVVGGGGDTGPGAE